MVACEGGFDRRDKKLRIDGLGENSVAPVFMAGTVEGMSPLPLINTIGGLPASTKHLATPDHRCLASVGDDEAGCGIFPAVAKVLGGRSEAEDLYSGRIEEASERLAHEILVIHGIDKSRPMSDYP